MIDSTQDQVNKLLAKPLVFPRGIFDPKPTFIKDEKITENPELYADWYRYTYEEHAFQEFYNIERDYSDNFEKENSTDKDFIENKKELSLTEKLALFKLKQDLIIKNIKKQDLFLKLIAEDLYTRIFNHKAQLSLKDLYKDRKERLIIAEQAKLQNQKVKGDISDNIINDSYIWDKTITYNEPQIKDTQIKLKDVSKIRRFIKNEKVQTILSYDKERKWSLEELEDTLYIKPTSYEVIRRENLFKAIHEFEKFILSLNEFNGINHPKDLELGGNPNFKCYLINGVLKEKKMVPEDEINWLLGVGEEQFKKFDKSVFDKSEIAQKAFLLILIRNMFAHNKLPQKNYYVKICNYVKNNEILSIAETIFWFANATINELKD